MIGQSLLHYRILSKLGEGGMGEVYLALDTKLERHVALKLLPAEMATESRRWHRFEREARAVAALNHPNIVTIYAVEQAEGRHFFAMELVEGRTLDEMIAAGGMDLLLFFAIAAQLTDALAAAHRQGILHRDLKPENVMVTQQQRVKVLDFGVAKAVRQQEKTEEAGVPGRNLTDEGAILGTARYMSPEQACGEPVDERSDLFSLGIVLFEMCTGAYPFQGRSAVEVLTSILRDDPPLPTAVRRHLPSRLATAIHRCLQKPPELRYRSAEELARDLEAARQQLSEEPEHDALAPTFEEPSARRRAGERAARRTRSVSATGASSSPALAVLPLVDLGGGPSYFADGLTEELITAVAKVNSLRVISRQSVMRYRGSDKLLPEIAREIGVDHILEGSVLRAGERVRISLQLIRAEPEQHLWAERFDRDVGDVLTVQSEVARAVAAEILDRLTSTDEHRLQPGRPVAPPVLEAYLKGRYHLNKRAQESLEKAVTCFEEAIRLDELHAPSFAGLADALALLGHRSPAQQTAERARVAARRALEIDSGLAEAHTSLGWVSYFYDWNWAAAEREFRRALELSPNQAEAHHWYWSLLTAIGERDRAGREIRRAFELDPLAPVIVTNLGVHHYLGADYARSIRYFRQARELDSGFPGPSLGLWRVFERLGDHDAAMQALTTALRELGRPEVASLLDQRYPLEGYGPAMEAAAEELATRGPAPVPLEGVAWLYLANGRLDKAMALVEDAFARRAPTITWLAAAPDWDPLRGQPRFRELLAAVGLPAA